MADTTSWAWVGTFPLSNFSTANQNNLNGQWNGAAIDPATYAPIVWSDRDGDGILYDNDSDGSAAAGPDRVIINGVEKTVHEVARYMNSTMDIGGQAYAVTVVGWVFTDGTFMVRLRDAEIPAGIHHENVTGLTIGTWDQQEWAGNYVSSFDNAFVCFAAGTLIDTAIGPRAVETLEPGDLVRTADHGDQPLRWIGRRTVRAVGDMAPVLISAGALGNRRDLLVSPQHRMVISGYKAELWFGESDVLVPAAALVNDRTIRPQPQAFVTYCHLLFDRHEIIFAEGAESESFHPLATALSLLDQAQRREVLTIFPELQGGKHVTDIPAARLCLRMAEGRVLCS